MQADPPDVAGPGGPRLVHELVESSAGRAPEAPAVYFGDGVISFAELARRARQVAALTADLTPEGGRLAMVGPNDPAWLAAYYGVPRAGRVLLFLNHRLAVPELGSLLRRGRPSVVVGPPEEIGALRSCSDVSPLLRYLTLAEWERLVDEAPASGAPSTAAVSPGDPAWLLYTSGTTGEPKGALLTHASLLAGVEVSAGARPVAEDATLVFPFPLCHVAGYNVLCHHGAGRPVVLLPRFDPATFLEATHRWRATSASVTATMVAALVEELDADEDARRALESLKRVAYGAAPMAPTLLRRLRRHLDVALTQGYGMTELSGNAAFLGPEEHDRGLAGEEHLLRAAGRPGPGVEIRVVDDRLVDVATGEPGEIVVRGPQVMAGYFEDPEATATTLVDGWLRTGDIGAFDAEGLLYVVDRKKDVIVTGGENVSSREVEDAVLRCCPEVRETAVVGVPDPRWGENVCAVVVAARGQRLDPDDVRRELRGQLAGFKLPRHVVVVDELPKNATGKVQKQELRRWLAERPDRLGRRSP